MYASFRSVTDKKQQNTNPYADGKFFVDLNELGILRDGHHAFFVHFLPSLHDNNVNLANFTFSGNVKTKQRDFVTFFLCREIYQNSRRLKRIFEVFENLLA